MDDDGTLRETVARGLDRAGHSVHQAGNGRDGLEMLGEHAIDIVVTDINMPDMDGLEVIIALGKAHPGLPVVAISGGGLMPGALLLESADALGAVEVLAKPFEVTELLAAVERVVAE
jgi:DNA-binding NtrC family response regulator